MVKLIIYDILDREVKRLVNNEFQKPGRHIVDFNGTNLTIDLNFRVGGEIHRAKNPVIDWEKQITNQMVKQK